MAEARTQHPFYMYEEIHAQPEAVRAVLSDQRDTIATVAEALRQARRVIVAGIGTSYHAAACVAWLARLEAAGLPLMAAPSYDVATYPFDVRAGDAVIVISHRGTKHYTGKVLDLARAAGAVPVLVTGQGTHEPPAGVAVLRTCRQDRSSAHTVSYVTALSVLALLLAELAENTTLRGAVTELPDRLADALGTEPAVRALAERFADRERIYFVGGGPHAVSAAEAALKVKETSYLVSEGFAVEQMLHGPMQAVNVGDLVVAIAPDGPSLPRMGDLLNAAGEIGAARIVIAAAGTASLDADACIHMPATRAALSPIISIVPLQLFAYYSAVARGRNPDSFRLDDPRYKRAAGRFQL